jgi:hypothetical protein
MGIVEDRASGYGELVTALAASKLFAGIYPPHIAIFAAWAFNAFGPAQAGEDFSAIFVSGERVIQFRERHDSTS